jgi:hypothetical protein
LEIVSPLGPRAVTATTLCEAPSWVIVSGVIVMVMDVPNSEGPPKAGASSFFIVHAVATAASASGTPRRRMNCIIS